VDEVVVLPRVLVVDDVFDAAFALTVRSPNVVSILSIDVLFTNKSEFMVMPVFSQSTKNTQTHQRIHAHGCQVCVIADLFELNPHFFRNS
jgi:hypothetical protein